MKMPPLPKLLLPLALALAAFGCRTTGRGAEAKATLTGPTVTRPTWIKSPEAIEGTIVQAWGIPISEKDRWKYLQSIYSMLGGTQVLSSKSLVDQPNELFALAVDNLSGWLSQRLVETEQADEAAGKEHSFDGLGLEGEDAAGCFKDDTKDWCDVKDGVRIGSLAAGAVDVNALPKEWKKRLMHNAQDVGEFMLLAVDNTLMMPNGTQHAADFLVTDVFLPTLRAGGPVSPASEQAAWKAVVYTILMSGGFYLEAPPQTNPTSNSGT